MAGPWEVASETPAPAPPSGGGWEVASEAPAIEEVTPTTSGGGACATPASTTVES
jgi:hypothetical protein